MKFPDHSDLGVVTIEGVGEFRVTMTRIGTLAPTPPDALREAAQAVVEAYDRYVLAIAHQSHPGQPHTRESYLEGGCGLCASAEYGTEAELGEYAIPDLRAALAQPKEANHD